MPSMPQHRRPPHATVPAMTLGYKILGAVWLFLLALKVLS